MYNWNKIHIGYCDGGSFAGTLRDTVLYSFKNISYDLHFKGKYILDATYDTLLDCHGMKNAKEIVISGSSAGGLAVFLHLDYLAEKILSSSLTKPSIVGVADGGFFMSLESITGMFCSFDSYL